MPQYITGDELATIIKTKTPNKDYLVVDVRDDDFAGGNIKHAKNIPSNDFLLHVDKLVQETKHIDKIVFHCALSQIRGPKAARIYEETVMNVHDEGDPIPDVYILRDGFTLFQQKFKDDPALVEGWDASVWASNWS